MIYDIKPQATAQYTDGQVSSQGYTYNEVGLSYNEAGVTYGGFSGSNFRSPTGNKAQSILTINNTINTKL